MSQKRCLQPALERWLAGVQARLIVGLIFVTVGICSGCEQPVATRQMAQVQKKEAARAARDKAQADRAHTDDELEPPTSGLTYPAARRSDQVDQFHGNDVADPYRWLEDTDSAETRAGSRLRTSSHLAFSTALRRGHPFRIASRSSGTTRNMEFPRLAAVVTSTAVTTVCRTRA